MATITKRSDKPVSWRAQVAVRGTRESKTFSTKAEAVAWASERETQIRRVFAAGEAGLTIDKTLTDAFDRYEREVSVHKPGHRWEALRLAKIGRTRLNGVNGVILGSLLLDKVTPEILGAWRDQRMSPKPIGDEVLGSTVNRELKLISHVFTMARTEWNWMKSGSPTKDVRRPKESQHRERRITEDEIHRLCLGMGFENGPVAEISSMPSIAIAFLFAIETAMRAGEICKLRECDISFTDRVAYLEKTKNGTRREVPLSGRAIELLGFLPEGGDTLFSISGGSLDTRFRKIRDRCQIEGLTFHDTRHLAITRLCKKMGVMELASMVGHRDLNELQTYYLADAKEVAKRLA